MRSVVWRGGVGIMARRFAGRLWGIGEDDLGVAGMSMRYEHEIRGVGVRHMEYWRCTEYHRIEFTKRAGNG